MKILFYYLFKANVYNRAIDIQNIRTTKQRVLETLKNLEESIAWDNHLLNDTPLTVAAVDRLLRDIASNEDEIRMLKYKYKL